MNDVVCYLNNLEYVPKLKTLNLQSNQLQVVRDEALSGLESLNHLNLAENQLTSMTHSSFAPIWSNLINSSMNFYIQGKKNNIYLII